MLQWLCMLKPARPDMLTDGPTEEEMAAVGRHFQYWKELTERGQALVVGRTQTTDPDTLGLAVFQAETEEVARHICDLDPAVVAGVFSVSVRPYKVALVGDPTPFRP